MVPPGCCCERQSRRCDERFSTNLFVFGLDAGCAFQGVEFLPEDCRRSSNEATMRLPTEEKGIHIINIRAIEDIGYDHAESTVSGGVFLSLCLSAYLNISPFMYVYLFIYLFIVFSTGSLLESPNLHQELAHTPCKGRLAQLSSRIRYSFSLPDEGYYQLVLF